MRHRRIRVRLLLLLAIAASLAIGATVAVQRSRAWRWETPWQAAAPGLSWGTLTRLVRGRQVRVTVVRAELARWGLHVLDAREVQQNGGTAAQVCPRVGAVVNASFFAADRSPIGWVVAGGQTLSPPYRGTTGYGGWQLLLVRQGQVSFAPLGATPPTGVEEAVQTVPLLLRNGKVQPLKQTPPASRAAVALDREGRVLFAVAEGDVALQEWATCLRDALECREALGLDGGPSAQLAVRGTTQHWTASVTQVPVFLQLVPK